MPRKYNIKATSLGTDTELVDIYHTSATLSNLLTSSVSASQLLTTGFDLIVNDNTSSFIVVNSTSPCSGSRSSVDEGAFEPTKRFFDLIVATPSLNASTSGTGSVSISAPSAEGPSDTSLSQTVDYSIDNTFTATASPSSNYNFTGWYTSSITSSGALLSTSSTLNISENQYTQSLREDNFYAIFSFAPPSFWSVTSSLSSTVAITPTWQIEYTYNGGTGFLATELETSTSETQLNEIPGTTGSVDILVYKKSNGGIAQAGTTVSYRVIGGSVQLDSYNIGDDLGIGGLISSVNLDLAPFQPQAQVEVIIEES